MTTVSQLPIWLSGDLSEFLYENEANASIAFPKKIKITLEFAGLRDILEMIDTCAYLGVNRIPFETYGYALCGVSLAEEVREFESNMTLREYSHFIHTPEYAAIALCVKNQSNCRETLLEEAVHIGDILITEYCIEHLKLLDTRFFIYAILPGNLEIIKYMLSQKPWNQPNKISYLKTNECFCNLAAEVGAIDILAFFREKLELPWTESTVEYAVRKNKYATVKYAVENGCPFEETAVDYAVMIGSMEILQLLVLNSKKPVDSPYLLNYAGELKNIAMMRYLYDIGVRPNAHLMQCVGFGGDPECIQFAATILHS